MWSIGTGDCSDYFSWLFFRIMGYMGTKNKIFKHYFKGGTVMQWLALLSHSKKV